MPCDAPVMTAAFWPVAFICPSLRRLELVGSRKRFQPI